MLDPCTGCIRIFVEAECCTIEVLMLAGAVVAVFVVAVVVVVVA